jgi:glycosyltransferase involved in cell wall biosynthesis
VRIAYLARPRNGNGFYRGIGPMVALAQVRGHQVRELPIEDRRGTPPPDVRDIDVLHVHRFCEDRAVRLARAAKEAGAAVMWDNDDDHGSTPRGVAYEREWTGFAWDRRLVAMKRMFRFTDLVTTTTPRLAEQLRSHGAPHVEVIQNYIPDHFMHPDRRSHAGVVIGWVAGLEHAADVTRLPIRETLQRLLDERSDVRVVSFGLSLGLHSARYHHIPGVEILELGASIIDFDIAIAPLADIDFNHSRSNVKLKEYAAVGIPWLASPIGPYAGMGEKQGGRLVPDDRWYEELSRLIDKPRERRKLAKRARKWAAGEALSKNAYRWEAALTAAIERSRAAAAA